MVSATRSTATILMAEDNPDHVELVREALDASHIDVDFHVVEDGELCLDFLYRRGSYDNAPTPDLILLDLNMPRMNGIEVLQHIKVTPGPLRRIPVIILTTSRTKQDVQRAYDLYCNAYIVKPVDIEQLVAILKQLDEFYLTTVTLPPKSTA